MLKNMVEFWLRFAKALAQVNSILLLTLVFFLVVVPLGVLFRLSGRSITSDTGEGTRWVRRPSDLNPEKPF